MDRTFPRFGLIAALAVGMVFAASSCAPDVYEGTKHAPPRPATMGRAAMAAAGRGAATEEMYLGEMAESFIPKSTVSPQ